MQNQLSTMNGVCWSSFAMNFWSASAVNAFCCLSDYQYSNDYQDYDKRCHHRIRIYRTVTPLGGTCLKDDTLLELDASRAILIQSDVVAEGYTTKLRICVLNDLSSRVRRKVVLYAGSRINSWEYCPYEMLVKNAYWVTIYTRKLIVIRVICYRF